MLAPELSVPALFAAGLLSAPHCGLMCGPLQGWLLAGRGAPARRALPWLHAGRVLGYAALGALAGGAGGALLRLFPSPQVGQFAQGLAALALVVVAVRQWRAPAAHAACHARRAPRLAWLPESLQFLARGMAWSLLPCGLLYAALLLASFSGSAVLGAALMAAFGAGTIPVLAAAGVATRTWMAPARLRRAASALLLVFGVASTLAVLAPPSWLPEAWCAPGALAQR